MSKRADRSISRRKALERALRRLGMHAKPPVVVAALADEGIEVSQDLVRRMKMEMLKGTDSKRQLVKAGPRVRAVPYRPKVPNRR